MRNRASATAKIIAAATVFQHAQDQELSLVSGAAAQLCANFLSTSIRDRLLLQVASRRSLVWLCLALERATLPGIIVHYAKRKRTIEREVRAHLQSTAISSVYVLGAGYDTLSLRIASEFPNVQFVELDHPATQAVKTHALAQAQAYARPKNLEFRACDLRTALVEKLFTCSQTQAYSPCRSRETNPGNRLVIAEGLLMYFTAKQVECLLAGALNSDHNSAGSNICIFSYMEQTDDLPAGFRPRSWLIERWLSFKREPFLWSACKDALAEVVFRAGGEIERLIAASDFDGAALLKPIKGENLVVARTR